ncbi:hypothetical protein E2562_013102 [Oryza meyeriana var. granulata]|uniref:Clathrin/coatomer adaptor adaptin-like N-terminal domain-containing protein n=1 Tax=Oryza meyeriana var. granulata TaxID=110450 RepID=A0A6G1F7X0_9ORYZ|nr:hypothetical protein E2562_013102 [Oryza meyeriana var. granulata]
MELGLHATASKPLRRRIPRFPPLRKWILEPPPPWGSEERSGGSDAASSAVLNTLTPIPSCRTRRRAILLCTTFALAASSGLPWLRDMIWAIRMCKTAAEERVVVRRECAAILAAINEGDQDYRHRNMAELMFIHMLGYPTHFGQMECLKLISAAGFPEKRIGYLGLMLLLNEWQEVLLLVTNSLKQYPPKLILNDLVFIAYVLPFCFDFS